MAGNSGATDELTRKNEQLLDEQMKMQHDALVEAQTKEMEILKQGSPQFNNSVMSTPLTPSTEVKEPQVAPISAKNESV